MGSSGWVGSDIGFLLHVFMKHFLMIFSLYSIPFSLPCPLVRTKFPSRVIHTPLAAAEAPLTSPHKERRFIPGIDATGLSHSAFCNLFFYKTLNQHRYLL